MPKNKEQKKMQKVAKRKIVAKQHRTTDAELRKHTNKSMIERTKGIQLRRMKKEKFDPVVDDTTQPQSARNKKR